MLRGPLVSFALMVLGWPCAIEAATLTNRDNKAHKIVVTEYGSRKVTSIGAGKELEGVCAHRCLIYIGADPVPYQIAGSDSYGIKDGELFLEELTFEDLGKQ